jgi:hypothetical protein
MCSRPFSFWSERVPTASLMGMPIAFLLVLAWLFWRYWLLTDGTHSCVSQTLNFCQFNIFFNFKKT